MKTYKSPAMVALEKIVSKLTSEESRELRNIIEEKQHDRLCTFKRSFPVRRHGMENIGGIA
jgi:hypothetical protein